MEPDRLHALANEARAMPPLVPAMFPPSTYYRFLYLVAAAYHPTLAVELGVCGGGGSLHLALGYPLGKVIGVDVTLDHPDQIGYIWRRCPNFLFWEGDSVLDAPLVAARHGVVSLLFIDTIHTRTRTEEELGAWRPFLAPGYLVCFDDLFRPEMAGLWEALPEPKMRLDFLHDGAEQGGGFGVIWQ